ncbi:MAG: hypothetical protein CMO74_14920 [Verrucomicrobiales bacterium]|nr:hypothetical protein [Verrucomicrobiales bacterium]|tara:strand:+ start:1189 stop:3639 length:2451 start_codon:yes stop_codon:yes gene_type:complete
MNEWLLTLLGVEAPEGARISDVTVAVQSGVEVGWIVILGVVAALVTFVSYRWLPSEITLFRRSVLTGLRLLFFALLLGLLLMPVARFNLESDKRLPLLVLADTSDSMALAEPRTEAMDIRRAALALGSIEPGEEGNASGADFGRVPRIELMRAALTNENYNLLPSLAERFDVVPFGFGLEPAALGGSGNGTSTDWVASLDVGASATAIGGSLAKALGKQRESVIDANGAGSSQIAGVVMATDGANNAGLPPGELVARLQREGVPLYIYGVGITNPRDIQVHTLEAPDAAFVNDTVPIQVRVRSQGMAGKSAELRMDINGEVQTKPIEFTGDGEQVVDLLHTPTVAGDFDLTVSIEPREDETEADNNSLRQRFRVVDREINVLLIEQSPRWEFRYLFEMLRRDKRVNFKTWLIDGDDSLAEGFAGNSESPYVKEFPDTEKLREYDVIILGDVARSRMEGAAGPLELLRKFVGEQGGSLLVLAGKQHCPVRYVGTDLDAMLPVVLSSSPQVQGAELYGAREVKLERTPRGMASPLMRLDQDEEENENVWNDLPGVYWVADVERAKPSAQVFMVVADADAENEREKNPVLAMHSFGAGNVMYLGTDNLWRWRANTGDLHHTTIWSQLVQRMALPRLMGFSRDVQLKVAKRTYRTGDRVKVQARLFDQNILATGDLQLVYRLQGMGGPGRVVRMQSDEPGVFTGEFLAPDAGQYELNLQDPRGQSEVLRNEKRYFAVREYNLEKTQTAMNESLLRGMAEKTGGAFFREENLHELPSVIPDRMGVLVEAREKELWSSWVYFLLLLLVITVEWVIRKLSYLK